MKKQDLVRVFVKGGILSPGDFKKIMLTAKELGTDYVHFGSRQDILFPVKEKNKEVLDTTFESINTEYEVNEFTHQNIVSSYVALDVMPNRKWLVPHVYHYIIDSFEFKPKYRINLVDPMQSMVPLFTGNINFIASKTDNFWYLYIRFKSMDNRSVPYPKLIYGYDLAKVATAVCSLDMESGLFDEKDVFKLVDTLDINTVNPEEELKFPSANFPYYEGLNREPGGNYWLGLYWRNNKFNINFLVHLCDRCMETNVGKISLTPWKSFVVKGIDPNHLIGWEKLMGRFGMNLRHSSLELNWHLPVLHEKALDLKNYLVRALDQQDISTSGLTFTIKPDDDIYLFTSVVIEMNPSKNDLTTYNILYSKNFNPNESEYFTYVKNATKEVLPALLIELSQMYYEQLDETPVAPKKKQKIESQVVSEVHQCSNCLSEYDEEYGDDLAGIAPGISFKDLPEDYACPTCGSPKASYKLIKV
ncbi:rubredoxin domain-containing protein [Reichenbachiella versicolor]|uniref:rubredoxin domain-containing protein n=1 Tax=Reichenbachiella versicolor TaxID=1821036 RepID=UPI000D6E4630|nr:rubredoxin domain-containing protein [Reichenbachiella versicolor]